MENSDSQKRSLTINGNQLALGIKPITRANRHDGSKGQFYIIIATDTYHQCFIHRGRINIFYYGESLSHYLMESFMGNLIKIDYRSL